MARHNCATGRDVGGPQEAITVTTLAELDPQAVDMRCLLLVGSSQTRTVPRPAGPLVFTPRRYPATVSEPTPGAG